MSTTNETYPLLVPALCQFNHDEAGKPVEIITAYDKTIVDAVVEELQRQLRVATMPTDRATGITGEQSDHLVNLINDYVQASIAESWKGAQPPEDATDIARELMQSSKKLNEYLTLLRAPV